MTLPHRVEPGIGAPQQVPTGRKGPPPGTHVLVTGASGFIGAHLTRWLVEAGCRVTILVRPSSDLWRIQPLLDRVDVVVGDLAAGELRLGCGPLDIVYHLAAAGVDPTAGDTAGIVQANSVGTIRMLELALEAGATRFVYCGSCFEYGAGGGLREDRLPHPLTEYGASKSAGWLIAQAFARRHGLPLTSLRPFTVYGPLEAGRRLIPFVAQAALEGRRIELTAGDQRRDFVFVEDAVEAFVRASVSPTAVGATFNVCSGEPVSVREIVSTILELTGSTSEAVYGAREYRETDVAVLSGDPSAAARAFGWQPRTPLRAGLEATIRALRDRGAFNREVAVT